MHGKPAALCVFAPLRDSKKRTSGTPTRVTGAVGGMKEILVLGNDDPVFSRSTGPDAGVRHGGGPEVQDVDRIRAVCNQPLREGDRQLVVHEQPHAAVSTA